MPSRYKKDGHFRVLVDKYYMVILNLINFFSFNKKMSFNM